MISHVEISNLDTHILTSVILWYSSDLAVTFSKTLQTYRYFTRFGELRTLPEVTHCEEAQ